MRFRTRILLLFTISCKARHPRVVGALKKLRAKAFSTQYGSQKRSSTFIRRFDNANLFNKVMELNILFKYVCSVSEERRARVAQQRRGRTRLARAARRARLVGRAGGAPRPARRRVARG